MVKGYRRRVFLSYCPFSVSFFYLYFKRRKQMEFIYQVVFRAILAVFVGALIGSERAKHGRAAGRRTHILVCLGATLTSLTGIFAIQYLGNEGDILRLSAQVVSGVGFLGAGMIILKNNSEITGLTTAAGVWATSVIGIAIGMGFYIGVAAVTVLYLAAIIIFAKIERKQKNVEVLYLEINDMYKANSVMDWLKNKNEHLEFKVVPPKSNFVGNLGLIITARQGYLAPEILTDIPELVYFEEE